MLIITIRTVLLYFLIVFSLRLMGKKQLGELQPSELVTTIMVSNIATLALEDASTPMLMGVIPILMIVSLDVIMSGVLLKSTKIRKAFREAIPGTTKLIIAQRISSIQDANRIIVMDEGKVTGFGTHEELLENNEIYREVYESQTSGSGDFDEKGEL